MGRPIYYQATLNKEAREYEHVKISDYALDLSTQTSKQGYIVGYFNKEAKLSTTLLGSVPIVGPFLAAMGAEKENKGRALAGSALGQSTGYILQSVLASPAILKKLKGGRFTVGKMLGLLAATWGTALGGGLGTHAATLNPREMSKYKSISDPAKWWQK